MTQKTPKITLLNPIVYNDNRRVMLEMDVEHLPTLFSNVSLMMPDLSQTAPAQPPKPDPNAPSPYPNIELAILDSQNREVASLLIIEHKEPHTSLTLHLRAPNSDEQYTAKAEMSYQDQVIDVVEVPFNLNQTGK